MRNFSGIQQFFRQEKNAFRTHICLIGVQNDPGNGLFFVNAIVDDVIGLHRLDLIRKGGNRDERKQNSKKNRK
jgi:hypothetical protein